MRVVRNSPPLRVFYWIRSHGVLIMSMKSRWMLFATCVGLGMAVPHAMAREGPVHVAAGSDEGCLAPATWAVPEAPGLRVEGMPEIVTAMAARDVVLLGEQHDDADHHRWQLQTLAALHAQRPDMVIGFEMFPRRAQGVLDRWVAGELTEAQFLEQTQWDEVWSMPAELYLPLFHFARLNRLPMVALNVDRELTRSISMRGWEAIPALEREGVGKAAEPSPAYVDALFEIHRQHARMRGFGGAKLRRTDAAFRNFTDAQLVWDRAMAEALARPLQPSGRADGGTPLVVGIMGSGHVRFGHGVPHQLRDLGIGEIGTLLPLSAASSCGEIPAGLADAVFAVPAVQRAEPPPPRLGIGLDAHREGIRVVEVTAGSLAESTGFRAEDVIIEVAGAPVKRSMALIATIRAQPAGTWLPMKVRRGGDTVELVVKFPAKS